MRTRWFWNALIFLTMSVQSGCDSAILSSEPVFVGLPPIAIVLIIFLIGFVVTAIGIAVTLVHLGAKISIVVLFVSSIIASFAFAPFWLGNYNSHWKRKLTNWSLLTASLTSFGSLLAFGFFVRSQILLLPLTAVGFLGVPWLALEALAEDNLRPKFGLYTAAFVLSYELWLLLSTEMHLLP